MHSIYKEPRLTTGVLVFQMEKKKPSLLKAFLLMIYLLLCILKERGFTG